MAKFEKVTRFADADITLPVRKTANSAGYDFVVAEDTLVPSYPADLLERLLPDNGDASQALTIDEMAALTKKTGAKPTLVSTGMKCALDPDTYLELSVRSSSPLKYWLVLANGVGIIDADYYNNPDNEGEIFFQIINFTPYPILLKKGDAIGQGIIKSYLTTEDDAAAGSRVGGFGSTGAR
jgi:dUTP pyrophosphatase